MKDAATFKKIFMFLRTPNALVFKGFLFNLRLLPTHAYPENLGALGGLIGAFWWYQKKGGPHMKKPAILDLYRYHDYVVLCRYHVILDLYR